jgi:hypothetical protein
MNKNKTGGILPSHMNLKQLLSIPFLYLSGTTHALATQK